MRSAIARVLIGICLGLAWWQWGRAHSLTGGAQNFGYALQWPAFAGFVAYFWYRMLRIERQVSEGRLPADTPPRETVPPGARTVAVRRSSRPLAAESSEPPDEQLNAYNAYLAALNASKSPTRRNDL